MPYARRGRAKTYDSDSLLFRSILGVLLIAIGVLSLISIVGGVSGAVFTAIKQGMQGLGGVMCPGIPLFFIWGGALVAFSARRKAPVRAILLLLLLYFCVLGILNLLSKIGTRDLLEYAIVHNQNLKPPAPDAAGYWAVITAGYQLSAASGAFGGALGMLTAWPLWTYTSYIIGVAILGAISLTCVLFFSKLDVVGMVRHFRGTSDQRLEQRELKRQQKVYEKQLAAQERAEADSRGLTQNQTAMNTPMQPAQYTQPMPGQTQPAAPQGYSAFAGNAAWPQGMPAMNGTQQLMPQAAFPNPANVPQGGLFNDMIVPELPDGASTPTWKLKKPLGKKSADTAGALTAIADAPVRDRDMNRALEKMEDNRKRKEQIQQRISNPEETASSYNYTLDDARLRSAAKQTRAFGSGLAANPPAASAQNVSKPGAMSREQIAYANQTAAYRAPDEQTRMEPAAPVNDPFSAYKKPAGSQLATGQRSNQPNRPTPPKAEHGATTDGHEKAYPYPMIELLNLQTQTPPDTREMDRLNAIRLEQTLDSFGIPAQVQHVTHGPAVTRFELGLNSSGINVKRIMNIADNIALDMAANGGVRIEVPIPGTNLFGVEVPNQEIIGVSLAEVLTSPEMTNAKSPLSVALGKDISGRPVICDLAKMPHLLIAGQTGSGKSVCINAIINSLLFRASPEEVRMIMIDPKVVELQGYNHVPHLLIPVVSDSHKAAGALAWAVQEMLDRYHKMQSKGVREITAYNAKVKGDEPKLPRIVIIIDELSDLMLACKKEVEESIIRLAQLARAAGIHVVIATQRPTVNVITGLIKANVPSRIAFAVASSIDSRTILDMNGAEKLLGRGDMFYFPTGAKAPTRVQGCFVSDAEINNVVEYIGNNSETDYDVSINEIMESQSADETDADADDADDSDQDDRLQEAVEMVLTDGQASISMLQRRMKIGYARAGRLIDDMAARGIVSKSAGSKPREILISYEQYLQKKDAYLR